MRAGACEALARTALVARHHDLGRRALAAARSPPRARRRAARRRACMCAGGHELGRADLVAPKEISDANGLAV